VASVSPGRGYGGVVTAKADSDLQIPQSALSDSPNSAQSHFDLAESLRKAGRGREAAQEYLAAGGLDPAMYVAYHQLSTVKAEQAQFDEGIERLSKLKDQKPKDLMLRIALSELLEKRSNYYQAARVLIDLGYMNAVPDKFQAKVSARIHYLLTMAKTTQTPAEQNMSGEEELDASAPPLPDSTLQRNIGTAKIKEPKVMRGVGQTRLLQ